MWLASLLGLLVFSLLGMGCSDENQDPEGAAELFSRVEPAYRGWSRAPGYERRAPARGPHGDEVEVFVSPVVSAVLAKGAHLDAWPLGSLIAKDAFAAGVLQHIALMEKRDDGWYWAEYSAAGEATHSGRPNVCTDCHTSANDAVRAFDLP